MNERSSEGVQAMAAYSEAMYRYYQGLEVSCGNVSYGLNEWETLMWELVRFAGLIMETSAAYLSGAQELELLSGSMDALYKGSAGREIPVQPTQQYLDRVIDAIYPAFQAYATSAETLGAYANAARHSRSCSLRAQVRSQEEQLYERSKNLMQSYTNEALRG